MVFVCACAVILLKCVKNAISRNIVPFLVMLFFLKCFFFFFPHFLSLFSCILWCFLLVRMDTSLLWYYHYFISIRTIDFCCYCSHFFFCFLKKNYYCFLFIFSLRFPSPLNTIYRFTSITLLSVSTTSRRAFSFSSSFPSSTRTIHHHPKMSAVLPNIHFEAEVTSTMDRAKDLIPTEGHKPFAVAAEVQLAGRGSEGRTWVSPKGNLYFTVVIPLGAADGKHSSAAGFMNPDLLPVMPLVVGIACQRAVQQLIPSMSKELVKTKWPNDLVYDHKKMGGSIAEKMEDYLLLGIGMNVHIAPPIADDGRAPTCLDEVAKAAGAPIIEPPAFATAIWKELFNILGNSTYSRPHVVKEFEASMDRSLELFRRLPSGRDSTPLKAVSLNDWGHLKVQRPDGSEEVLSAEYLF